MSRFTEGSPSLEPPPEYRQRPAATQEPDQSTPDSSAKGWRTAHNKIYALAFIFVLVTYLSLAAYAFYYCATHSSEVLDWTDTDSGITITSSSSSSSSSKRDSSTSTSSSSSSSTSSSGLEPSLDWQTLSIFLVATGTAFGFSSGVLFVATKWPIILVYGGYIMSILMLIASTALSVFLQVYIEAAFNAACLVLLGLVAWRSWSKLHIAAMFIKTTTLIANENKSVYVVVFVALIVSCVINVLNVAAAIAVSSHSSRIMKDNAASASTSLYRMQYISTNGYVGGTQSVGSFFKVILLLIAMFGAFSWIAATIDNVVVATLAGGPFSSWFKPPGSTKYAATSSGAFKAACSVSLGSLALGSLLLRLVHLTLAIVRSITNRIPFANILCCCITNLLERLAQWFNKSVRDFQHDYFDAAKQTLAFVKGANKHHQQHTRHLFPEGHYENGIGALINDVFTSSALHFGAFACALLCGLITFGYIEFANATSTEQLKDQYWEWIVIAYSFALGLLVCLTLTSAVEAGVSTIFVCIYDMEPEHVDVVLASRAPELHDLLMNKYQNAIGGRYQQPMGDKALA